MGRRCAGRVGRKKYIRNRENKSFRRIGDKREDEKRASKKACKPGYRAPGVPPAVHAAICVQGSVPLGVARNPQSPLASQAVP